MTRSISLILKVTDQCNLSCPYCYYYAGSAEVLRKRKFSDLSARIDELILALWNSKSCREAEGVLFAIHGGEPLLVPKPIIDRLAGALRERFGSSANIALQTNGVLIDDEWIEIFTRHEVSISVSVDGPAWLHDEARPDNRGRGSHARAVAGLERLQRAHASGALANPAVLAVFDPRMSGDAYCDYFFDDLGVGNFDILFPDDASSRFGGDQDLFQRFDTVSSEIWHAWLRRDNPRLKVRFIDHALRAIARGKPVSFDPDNYQVLVADMQGDCFVEDALRAVMPFQELKIGDWRTEGFDTVLDRVVTYAEKLKAYPPACQSCERFAVCKGGDFSYRYDVSQEGFGQSKLCQTYKANFAFADAVIGSVRAPAQQG